MHDSRGKFCPFNDNRMCSSDCELYTNNKCAFVDLIDAVCEVRDELAKIRKDKTKES